MSRLFGAFCGIKRQKHYAKLVGILMKNYGKMSYAMSFKIHIIDAHLDKFKEDMLTYSDEQGRRLPEH